MRGTERADKVAELVREGPPGARAYVGGQGAGWAAANPRAGTSFATSRRIPAVDAEDAWSVWVSASGRGTGGLGVCHEPLAAAVDFARESGAPVVEGYPVDNQEQKVDLTMAYVGTRHLFERAAFAKAADTTSVLNGFPRVLTSLTLD